MPNRPVHTISTAQLCFRRQEPPNAYHHGAISPITASKAVLWSAFPLCDHAGPVTDFLLRLLFELSHLFLDLSLICLDFVFVHGDCSTGLLFRAVSRKMEPTSVKPQAGNDDKEQNDRTK